MTQIKVGENLSPVILYTCFSFQKSFYTIFDFSVMNCFSFYSLSIQARLRELSFEERGNVLEQFATCLLGVMFDIMDLQMAIPGSPDIPD